jgi:hypothetical protein
MIRHLLCVDSACNLSGQRLPNSLLKNPITPRIE